jgi:hypothetical protein
MVVNGVLHGELVEIEFGRDGLQIPLVGVEQVEPQHRLGMLGEPRRGSPPPGSPRR